MSASGIAGVVFACVFGSTLLGLFVRGILPDHHLNQDAKDVVKLGTGLIATMSALVLSLLISSAKSSFDRMNEELVENAARAVSLDRILADYGPETKEIRDLLKRNYAARLKLLFPSDESHPGEVDSARSVVRTENIRGKLWELTPANEQQRWLQTQAIAVANEIAATRWLMLMQRDVPMPMPVLLVLVFWLSLIFATFGLLAPRNATVIVALLVCALSTSGAILLIVEMNAPLAGLIKLSSAPMREALAELGH